MRAFGCRAWHKTKEARRKFEPRGARGILIGYSPESKAYKIWDEDKGKIILRRDVIFDEEDYPALNVQQVTQEKSKPKDTIAIELNATNDETVIGEPIDEPAIQPSPRPRPRPARTVKARRIVTRAGRAIKRPRWLQDYDSDDREVYVAYQKKSLGTSDPRTIREAMNSEENLEWKESIREEFRNLDRNGVWTLVKRKPGMKVIKSKCTFRTKRDENGNVARHKARLVALGNQLLCVSRKIAVERASPPT